MYTGLQLLSELRRAWTKRQTSLVTFLPSLSVIVRYILSSMTFRQGCTLNSNTTTPLLKVFVPIFLSVCPLAHLSEHFAWGGCEWEAVSSFLQSSYLCKQNKNQRQRCTACQYKQQHTETINLLLRLYTPVLFFKLCMTLLLKACIWSYGLLHHFYFFLRIANWVNY